MKKVNWIILVAFIASLGFFTSCGPATDPVAPEIILEGTSDVTINVGDPVVLHFSINQGDEKIEDVVIKKDDGIVYKASDSSEVKIEDGMVVNFSYVLNNPGTYVFDIEVTDKSGVVTTKTVNVTVGADYSEYTLKLLYAPLADKTSSSFFKSSTGETVAVTDFASNSADIDFGYFYANSKLAVLASPSDYLTTAYDLAALYPNATKNVTTFATSTANYANISSSDDIKYVYDNGTLATDGSGNNTATRVGTLSVGDVVAFKTAAGKYGVVTVTEISGTYNSGDYIKLDVKVQK